MFDKDFLKHLTDNLKRSGGQINVGGAMVATLSFNPGAKLQMILEATSNIVIFYNTVGRAITNTPIQWDPITKDFNQEWQILIKRKVKNVLGVPNISRALPIIKWTGYFANFLHRTVGEINNSRSYDISIQDNMPGV